MKAQVENNTAYPKTTVRQIVHRVLDYLDVNLPEVFVRVFTTDHWHHLGHFYAEREGDDGPILSMTLIARFVENPNGAHDRGLRGGPPPIGPRTWQESLVCILAHEGTHIRQFINGPRTPGHYRIRGGVLQRVKGRTFSEVEAEWAEYRALQWWRKEKKR